MCLKYGSGFIFLKYGHPIILPPFCEKTIFYSNELSWHLWPCLCLFSELCILFHCPMCLSFHQYHPVFVYGQLTFNKAPRIHNGERLVSSSNGAEKTGHPHAKDKTEFFCYAIYKRQLKWIKNLNVRAETEKL